MDYLAPTLEMTQWKNQEESSLETGMAKFSLCSSRFRHMSIWRKVGGLIYSRNVFIKINIFLIKACCIYSFLNLHCTLSMARDVQVLYKGCTSLCAIVTSLKHFIKTAGNAAAATTTTTKPAVKSSSTTFSQLSSRASLRLLPLHSCGQTPHDPPTQELDFRHTFGHICLPRLC